MPAPGPICLCREKMSPPARIPAPPAEFGLPFEQKAWTVGYLMGYKMGASDSELARVTEPGAHGMVRGLGEQMLEMLGVFRDIAK